ncbi:thioredoxin domain-containing protein [Candidatus Micrarchaeota archaeon]|nr:thioredoxin domain-containing protein [Candidatus Micrarchaeota archaeon]
MAGEIMTDENVAKKDDKITIGRDMVYQAAVVVLVVIVALSVYTSGFGLIGKNSTDQQNQNEQNNNQVKLGKTELPDLSKLEFLGDVSAPVLVIEFSDFQCPFCGIAWGREYGGPQYGDSKGAVQKIKADFVDTGKAKFIYYPVAFLGQESVDAAEAVLCAKDQNKFYDYHDELFKNQEGENEGTFNRDNLVKFAENVGLNKDQFAECIDGASKDPELKSLLSYYKAVVGTGTPTYFLAIPKDKVEMAKLKQVTDALNLADPPKVPNLAEEKEGKYYVVPVVGAQGYSKMKQVLDTVNY